MIKNLIWTGKLEKGKTSFYVGANRYPGSALVSSIFKSVETLEELGISIQRENPGTQIDKIESLHRKGIHLELFWNFDAVDEEEEKFWARPREGADIVLHCVG